MKSEALRSSKEAALKPPLQPLPKLQFPSRIPTKPKRNPGRDRGYKTRGISSDPSLQQVSLRMEHSTPQEI